MFTKSPGRHCVPFFLATLILGDGNLVRDTAKSVTELGLWLPVLNLSAAWYVVPQLRQRIDSHSIPLDPELCQQLHHMDVLATVRSVAAVHWCSTVVKRLHDHGVAALPFKGAGLIGNLYSRPSERTMSDVDILIRERDFSLAANILRELKFSSLADRVADFPDRVADFSDLFGNREVCFTNPDGVQIDLHWSIGLMSPPNLNAECLIQRAEQGEMLGAPVSFISPTDSILLTIRHVLQNSFAPSSTIKDLCDIGKWWSVEPRRWRLDEVIKHAELCGLLEPCLAAWNILLRFSPDSPARKGVERICSLTSARVRMNADRLCESFEVQISGRVLNSLLLRTLVRPSWVCRRGAIRIRETVMKRLAAPARIHRPAPRPLALEISQFVYETIHLNRQRMRAYRALLQAQSIFQSSCAGPYRKENGNS
jgi:hypothetical protein